MESSFMSPVRIIKADKNIAYNFRFKFHPIIQETYLASRILELYLGWSVKFDTMQENQQYRPENRNKFIASKLFYFIFTFVIYKLSSRVKSELRSQLFRFQP